LRNGKGKTSFSLSSRIKDFQPASLIRAPRAGRVDDFLQSHQYFLMNRPGYQEKPFFTYKK